MIVDVSNERLAAICYYWRDDIFIIDNSINSDINEEGYCIYSSSDEKPIQLLLYWLDILYYDIVMNDSQ